MTETKTYQDLGTFLSAELSDDKKRILVHFSPTTGNYAGKQFTRSAFVTSLDDITRQTIKTLTQGDPVTIDTIVNGKFRNLQGITKGHKKVSNYVAKPQNNDYNQRAARGQALSLATNLAIAEGKGHDNEYILSQVARFLTLSETVQEAKDVHNINPQSSTPTTNDASNAEVQPGKTTTKAVTGIKSSTPSAPSESSEVDDLADLLDL